MDCMQDDSAGRFHFRFDEAAFPWKVSDKFGNYMESWIEDHPDRTLCRLQTINYEAAKAKVSIVLHHDKPSED